MEIPQVENELIDTLYNLGFDKDDVVVVVLTLNTEANIQKMLNKINSTQNITRDEIFNSLDEIVIV